MNSLMAKKECVISLLLLKEYLKQEIAFTDFFIYFV